MIVSLNWLKKYTHIDIPLDELVQLIGARLVEIEEVINLGERYEGITVARAEKVYKHPNADKLQVVELNDAGAVQGVERLENGHVQVVCGAPNVREGLLVAWLPPGATVPATYADVEPFVLGARDMRGVTSYGMIGSGKELAINNDHDGIAELDVDYTPGTPLAEALELDDYLLDIENKSLTHRPDTFGLIGFAREVAAIQGKPFRSPDWLMALDPVLAEFEAVDGISKPTVTIENADLCPRYEAVVIAGVDATKQSPMVIQSYLKRVGIRPISAVVDVTNYLMVTTGHPLHAFDYNAFLEAQQGGDTPDIRVRAARQGENLTLLDNRTITLNEADIVICSGDTPVGLAGAMGGATTEVTDKTTTLLLESATFNLYSLRNTSMRHGIFSDAVTRFTKGQAAAQTAPVVASAVRMLCDITGGARASDIVDQYPGKHAETAIQLSVVHVNQVLGTHLSIDDIKQTLIHVECTLSAVDDQTVDVVPPYWRGDLHSAEDLIEEIGRIGGFDSIEPTLPRRPYVAQDMQPFDAFTFALRKDMARYGANEILTYSFVPATQLRAASQNPDDAYKIVNAISPDLQHYRTSLTPNVLDKVNGNIRQGFEQFALFEIGKVHVKQALDEADGKLPKEFSRLSMAVSATAKQAAQYDGAAYYQAGHYLASLLGRYGVAYTLDPLTNGSVMDDVVSAHMIAPYEPSRSALVVGADGQVMGVVGEYKPSVMAAFKLPNWSAGFELMLDGVFRHVSRQSFYTPLSRYPGTEKDVTLRVRTDVSYQQLEGVLQTQLQSQPYEAHLTPVGVYQKPDDDTHKNVTLRISLNNHQSTITTDQAVAVIDALVTAAGDALDAQQV